MHVARAPHAWFIFNLNTESHYISQILCYIIYMAHGTPPNPTPCIPQHSLLTYLENQLLFSWWQMPIHPFFWSANNCPTPCLPLSPFHTHSSNYTIYIDDISNLGRLRQGQGWTNFIIFSAYILPSVASLHPKAQCSVWKNCGHKDKFN
jgi:hypothetical protein